MLLYGYEPEVLPEMATGVAAAGCGCCYRDTATDTPKAVAAAALITARLRFLEPDQPC